MSHTIPHQSLRPQPGEQVHHACGIVGEHIAACNECGTVTELGWAHLCRDCWDRASVFPPETP